jgi:phage shock protein PspC (stress-responsive transcriptional regulator)
MTATMPGTPDGPTQPPPAAPPPSGSGWGPPGAPPKLLRRSRTDRYGVGVCGGLGEYFGVDPVIFRVVLAVLAVFGGAGVLLYLLLWLAIPEEGTSEAALDRGIAGLRRRHIPFGLAAAVAIILVWVVGFSWWTPHSLIPALIVGAIVLVLLSRRESTAAAPPVAHPTAGLPTSVDQPWPSRPPLPEREGSSSQLREWIAESRLRSRQRRERSFPVRIAILGALVVVIGALGLIDLLHGVPLALYFWLAGAILVAGLLVGAALRRTPWSLTVLFVPIVAGLVAFGTSSTSLHDGWGKRTYQPASVSSMHDTYKLAFGQTIVDLRQLSTVDQAKRVKFQVGAGELKLFIPRSLPVVVHSDVHIGAVAENGEVVDSGNDFSHDTTTASSSSAPTLIIDATVTDGAVTIELVG